jgi:AbrB family looped-hinge helix DNA binding protein
MIATVSVKGQTVIPEAIREMARIKAGDQLDVGYSGGLIVMRKRQALTPARVRSLLLGGRGLPEMTGKDETAVVAAVQRFRRFVMALGWLWVPNRLPTACLPNGFVVPFKWLWVAWGGLTSAAADERKRGHPGLGFRSAQREVRESGLSHVVSCSEAPWKRDRIGRVLRDH